MLRRAIALSALLLAFFFAACAGDDEPEGTPSSTPAVTATASPTETSTLSPTSTPELTTTATAAPASPTPDEDEPSTGNLTGEPVLDAVIEVVRSGEVERLAALMQPHEVKCTTVRGMGGPPKCSPGGGSSEEVPDGTVVESFPLAVCELEWQPDVSIVAERMLPEPGEWYAAVSVDGPLFGGETFFGEPYLPSPDQGLIFETPSGPLLLLLEGEGIVYASRFCGAGGGDPADFIEHPAYDLTVTHRGPAWEG